jgi:hypothetical protein
MKKNRLTIKEKQAAALIDKVYSLSEKLCKYGWAVEVYPKAVSVESKIEALDSFHWRKDNPPTINLDDPKFLGEMNGMNFMEKTIIELDQYYKDLENPCLSDEVVKSMKKSSESIIKIPK